MIADHIGEATILFADIVNFTPFAGRVPANDLVVFLDKVFSAFDRLAEIHAAEKIKTIGDAYMVAVGLLEERPDHAEAAARLAQAMLRTVDAIAADTLAPIALRIGLHTGPAVAGVIGRKVRLRRVGHHGEYREPDGIARTGRQNPSHPVGRPTPPGTLCAGRPRRDRYQRLRPDADLFLGPALPAHV